MVCALVGWGPVAALSWHRSVHAFATAMTRNRVSRTEASSVGTSAQLRENPRGIPGRRQTENAGVVPAELGDAFSVRYQQSQRLKQPHAFLILQGAERGDGFEMAVER